MPPLPTALPSRRHRRCPCCPPGGRAARRHRFTPPRPWAPLTDAEWTALIPYAGDHFYRPARSPGRPLSCDPRARLDAMLRAAVTDTPWHRLAEGRAGQGATIGRHFTRLAHAGLWSRLLEAVADPHAPPVLRAMEHWICRLARRAMRVLKMAGQDMARRLGLLSALPMVPWMLPDRHLSEVAHELAGKAVRMAEIALASHPPDLAKLPPPGCLARIARLMGMAGGRQRWSKRFAAP